ncbi:MAG: tyrosine--tRNA ligase [Gemmatimonadota bacterium]
MTDLLVRLSERGFIQDQTPGLQDRLAQGPIVAYIGFDPTADSLHVGNLVPVMGLAWLQRSGGTPIPLVGGGTGMVGDPSGKRNERPILSVAEIDANAEKIRAQLTKFLSFEGPNAARMRNNADWLREVSLMEFLRDTGKHFTLNYMLQKESVRSRMETGISFTEFSYMLVQAYDFWHLFRTEACELQMGGSDQWGNITAGTELVARRESTQVHGLVFPLLTTSSGAKFGKSEDGNIWLDPARTTPGQFYQFWYNTDDRDIERCLKLFTFLPLEEVAESMRAQAANPSQRPAQRRLAEDLTARVHGLEELQRIIDANRMLFQKRGDDSLALGEDEIVERSLPEGVPRHPVSVAQLEPGLPLVEVLVATGLASSKSDARRGIQGKGYYVDGAQIADPDYRLREKHFNPTADGGPRFLILRKGKKNHVALVIE